MSDILISKTEPTAYFVYGTLRPFDGGWADNGYTEDPVPATAKGDLWDLGPFPYADFDGEGTIQGDIITLDPAMAAYVARVEIGARYKAREVVAQTADGPRVVIGWQIDRPTDGLTLVPSGDWRACVEGREGRYSRKGRTRV